MSKVVRRAVVKLVCGCKGRVCRYKRRYENARDKLDDFIEGDNVDLVVKYNYEPDELIDDTLEAQEALDRHIFLARAKDIREARVLAQAKAQAEAEAEEDMLALEEEIAALKAKYIGE